MIPQPSEEEKRNAASAVAIRRMVGYLGVLLPILCFTWAALSHSYPSSISAYVYTPVHGPFTAILCGLGMVLYVYRGYDKWDQRATSIASVAAFGVGLFWTSALEAPPMSVDPVSWDHLRLIPDGLSGVLHDYSAGVLFLLFFFISGFLFTRRPRVDGQPPSLSEFLATAKSTWLFLRTPPGLAKDSREKENATHRRCAWVILVSIIVSVATSGNKIPWFAIAETTAILAFAWSWLTKNRANGNAVTAIGNDVRYAVEKLKG